MNGRIIPDTPIVVDLWRRVTNPSSKLYFLSHMHSDHTQGLSASWRWLIYCSPITAKLLVEKFKIDVGLVRPLELNTSHVVQLDHSGKETMSVMLFDANHCPGSVMFLFEGYFGRVFYTGDFRYDPATFPTSFVGPNQPVDRLYLDNTFNNPRCKFPSRSRCKEQILEILREHPEHEIVLAVYTLGKEDLLVDIALALQTRIVVSQSRMNMLQLLKLRDVFTTDELEGRVRLVRRQAISKKNMTKWNAQAPTIAIIPTGLFSILDGQPYANQDDVFIVPYSDHSSYPELQEFVFRVCPRVIHPIVRDSNFMNCSCSVVDMHNFDHFMDRSPSMPFDIPPSVQQHMSTNFSNPSSLFLSRKKFKKFKRALSNNRKSNPCSMGVVYEDNHDGEEVTEGEAKEEGSSRSPNSPSMIQCKVGKREQKIDENEKLGISSPSVIGMTKSVNRQKDEVLKQSLEEVCIAARNTGTCLPREDRWIESKTSKMQSQSSREGTTNLFPNLDKTKDNLALGKKDLFNKMRKRKLMEGDNSSGLGQETMLIQTMSSKKSRTLPPSFVVTPTTGMKKSSISKLNPPKLSSSSSSTTITDFFQAVNSKAQAVEKSERVRFESKQASCKAHVASLPNENKSRTNEQNPIFTVHKLNPGCESTQSAVNKSKSGENFVSIFYKRYSDKSKLTPVSTFNEQEALEGLTAAQGTKHTSEKVTSPCPLASSRGSLRSHPSETPFGHVVVIKRKYTKDVSEHQKRKKLTEALDKFILNHL